MSAYLVLQMNTLGKIAEKLDYNKEAVRVGESGKGFAVVDEVRKLA